MTSTISSRINGKPTPGGQHLGHDRGRRSTRWRWSSEVVTLLPGDVILTGTPAGVTTLHHGDCVEIDIEGIGTLRNPVLRRG